MMLEAFALGLAAGWFLLLAVETAHRIRTRAYAARLVARVIGR
jgi:hypothetical protein